MVENSTLMLVQISDIGQIQSLLVGVSAAWRRMPTRSTKLHCTVQIKNTIELNYIRVNVYKLKIEQDKGRPCASTKLKTFRKQEVDP